MKYKVKNYSTDYVAFPCNGERIEIGPGETKVIDKKINGWGLKTIEEIPDKPRKIKKEEEAFIVSKKEVEEDSTEEDDEE